jgi:hypothetical protein
MIDPKAGVIYLNLMKRSSLACGIVLCLVLSGIWESKGAETPQSRDGGVSISSMADRLVVSLDGQPFAEYVFANTSRPYCYPIYGPGQLSMTRNWPMKETPGESRDHPHHKGLWFTHGAVNGIDFWSEQKGAGKVLHDRFSAIKPGGSVGTIKSANRWVADDGSVICTDERTLQFQRDPKRTTSRIIDFEILIRASHGPLTFGDTKEGTMAIRIAESMRLSGGLGKGRIVNSRGLRDKETWGKRAEWCDYYGPVDGKTVGVAIFDHPANPRHPTWWHVRDYGLFAANPFGQHDFEKLQNPSAGDLKVENGSSIRFKYRFFFHEGDELQGEVAAAWREFIR